MYVPNPNPPHPPASFSQVLREVFGPELASEVAARYLQEQSNGRYRFRTQFARWVRRGQFSSFIEEQVAAARQASWHLPCATA